MNRVKGRMMSKPANHKTAGIFSSRLGVGTVGIVVAVMASTFLACGSSDPSEPAVDEDVTLVFDTWGEVGDDPHAHTHGAASWTVNGVIAVFVFIWTVNYNLLSTEILVRFMLIRSRKNHSIIFFPEHQF